MQNYLQSVLEALEEKDNVEMLWNVLDEVVQRAASACSDRHCARIVEELIGNFSAHQLRLLLSHCSQYHAFLWTNRYSSHVLQTILARAGPILDDEAEGIIAFDVCSLH